MGIFKNTSKKLRRYGLNAYGAFRVGKVKQMIHAPFVMFKNHYCPICETKMKIEWITQQIYEGTPEAENKNLLFGFNKPVEYTFAIFSCSKCGHRLSINDQFYIEYPKRLDKYQKKHGDYKLKDDYHTYLQSIKKK